MIYYIIPLVIIICSAAGIAVIIMRKYPQLISVNLDTVQGAREAIVRERIMLERFKRSTEKLGKKLHFFSRFAWIAEGIKKAFLSIRNKLVSMEERYEMKLKKSEGAKDGGVSGQINALIEQAEEFIKDEAWQKAESYYIEAISLDNRNKIAYKGLADLYLAQKEYKQAKETLDYLFKLYPQDDEVHYDLGWAHKCMGDIELSLGYFRKAALLEPNNPRNLDILIETCIMVGDKKLAREALKKLKGVNPENQKLADLEARIRKMDEKRCSVPGIE